MRDPHFVLRPVIHELTYFNEEETPSLHINTQTKEQFLNWSFKPTCQQIATRMTD